MKIIEALKEIKALKIKAEDLRKKIAQYCVKASYETDTYLAQRSQVDEWLQSHSDTVKRIVKLNIAVSKTNLLTNVDIQIGNKVVTHSIAEWVLRRRELAELERLCWAGLTDKGIREGSLKQSDGTEIKVEIVRFYDPKRRDEQIELYRTEPSLIDRTLEVINAVTDIIE